MWKSDHDGVSLVSDAGNSLGVGGCRSRESISAVSSLPKAPPPPCANAKPLLGTRTASNRGTAAFNEQMHIFSGLPGELKQERKKEKKQGRHLTKMF